MKILLTTIATLILASTASAAPLLLERECFNARNGETYVCRIDTNLKAEIINEDHSMTKKTVTLKGGKADLDKYIGQLKTDKDYSKQIESVSPKFTDKYVHRGMKAYSVYVDGKKQTYFKVVPVAPKKRSKKAGTNEYRIGTKNVGGKLAYNQLRFITDQACAQATGTSH